MIFCYTNQDLAPSSVFNERNTSTSNITTHIKNILIGKINNKAGSDNDYPEWTSYSSSNSSETAEAVTASIIPHITTNLDFNMPYISEKIIGGQTLYECVRLPNKFYNLDNTPYISNNVNYITDSEYNGTNKLLMYIKSTGATFTPHMVKDVNKNNVLFNTNTQNSIITSNNYKNTISIINGMISSDMKSLSGIGFNELINLSEYKQNEL